MTGPGIWIRIRGRFGTRLTEWLVATHTALFGLVLLLPASTFSNSAVWAVFTAAMDENAWGWLMFVLGLARLTGLWVNGTRPRVTPLIRVASAAIGFLMFTGISFGFALSGVVGIWLSWFPLLAAIELINARRAATDVGESYA